MIDFLEATVPAEMDEAPPLADVTDPCKKCHQQIDTPYGGRGPRPKFCLTCKSTGGTKRQAPRITGKDQNLAAQATTVLVQLNSMIALGAAALGLFRTGGAIVSANEGFEAAAYQALLTDPELCKSIMRSGAKSGKVALTMAYGGLAMAVIPTAAEELKDKKAARDLKREELANENADGA
jgi:hypothetical protein